jgi:hypothetical protein
MAVLLMQVPNNRAILRRGNVYYLYRFEHPAPMAATTWSIRDFGFPGASTASVGLYGTSTSNVQN